MEQIQFETEQILVLWVKVGMEVMVTTEASQLETVNFLSGTLFLESDV